MLLQPVFLWLVCYVIDVSIAPTAAIDDDDDDDDDDINCLSLRVSVEQRQYAIVKDTK